METSRRVLLDWWLVRSLCRGLQYVALSNYISKSRTIHLPKYITLKIGTPEALKRDLRVLRPLRTIKIIHSGSPLVRQMLHDFQVEGCISMCRAPSPCHPHQGIQEDASLPSNDSQVSLTRLWLPPYWNQGNTRRWVQQNARTDPGLLFFKAPYCGSYLNMLTDI